MQREEQAILSRISAFWICLIHTSELNHNFDILCEVANLRSDQHAEKSRERYKPRDFEFVYLVVRCRLPNYNQTTAFGGSYGLKKYSAGNYEYFLFQVTFVDLSISHYFFCSNPNFLILLGIPYFYALSYSSCISYPHETSAMHPSGTSAVRQCIGITRISTVIASQCTDCS